MNKKINKKAEKLCEQEKYEELLKLLVDNPEEEDSDWNAFMSMAFIELGRDLEAIPHLRKVILILLNSEDPDDANEFMYGLAEIYYRHNMIEEYKDMYGEELFPEYDLPRYSEEEEKQVIAHIEKHFGKIEKRFRDFVPSHMRLDILLIPPSTKHPYTTLVTLGMGSTFMEGTPEELVEESFGFAELFLCLPDDWDLVNEDIWPLQCLFELAKFPFVHKNWFGAGHSLSYESYIDTTNFSGFLITYPYEHGMEAFQLDLDNKKSIHFYNALPLYPEELDFKESIGFDELEELFEESPMVTNVNRKNVAFFLKDLEGFENEEDLETEENEILYQ